MSDPPKSPAHLEDRVIRIFVSSTFRDMQEEREELVGMVLASRCGVWDTESNRGAESMPRRGPIFRVFVSSTFSHLIAERNALHERVFPKLVDYCCQQGASFQAIDLRWRSEQRGGPGPADDEYLSAGVETLPEGHTASELHRAAARPLRLAAAASVSRSEQSRALLGDCGVL